MNKIYTALITPFQANGKIDYVALKHLLSMQAKSKVTGVVILGSTGEEKLLSKKEKLSITKLATKMLKTKEVYVGINEISIKDAQKSIKTYSKYHITGYLLSPPPYLKLTQREIINFYSKVAKTSTKNICIYNIPSRTGTKISAKTIANLAKIKNITAVKDATGDLSFTKELLKVSNGRLSILCGNDGQYQEMCKFGCHGAVCVIGNLYPNLFCSSNLSSKKIQQNFASTISMLSHGPNPATIKYLLSQKGYIHSTLREPLLPYSANFIQ